MEKRGIQAPKSMRRGLRERDGRRNEECPARRGRDREKFSKKKKSYKKKERGGELRKKKSPILPSGGQEGKEKSGKRGDSTQTKGWLPW